MSSLTEEEADDLFDTLEAEIEAASSKEAELEAVLTRLEDLILEDILAGDYDEADYDAPSGSVTPSTASVTPAASEYGGTGREQTFIQQKSLALLPLLCRFPSFTPSASEKIVKLIVLVSKRLNPKELWLGLDSVVETSRVGLEALADGDGIGPEYEDEDEEGQDMEGNGDLVTNSTVQDSPEHISVYLSRGLLAMQILLPRIHVKKPEKYLKPVLDALTGCLSLLHSPEVRSQIVSQEDFSGTLLLVNLMKGTRDAWVWADGKHAESNPSLKQGLCRLYLLTTRSLLPLCPEAAYLFTPSTKYGAKIPSTEELRSLLLEPAIVLDIDSIQELESHLLAENVNGDHEGENCKHVQRTFSYILVAALMAVDPPLSEAQSQQILRILPALVYFVLQEDVDESLQSVALDAVLYLGYVSTKERPAPIGTAEAVDKSQKSSAFESISAALQAIITHFEEIVQRPPLVPNVPAPARKVLDLCQRLVLDLHLEPGQRDELIATLLKNTNPHIRTVGISVLRKLLTDPDQTSLPPSLSKHAEDLFSHDLTEEDISKESIQAWLVSLLNYVYLYNIRLSADGFNRSTQESLQVEFLQNLGMLLNVKQERLLHKFVTNGDEETELPGNPQDMQLEIMKDAWKRACQLFTAKSSAQ